MKKLVLPLAILAMAALLAGAAAWDCARLAADGGDRVALADAELRKHEVRFMSSLAASPKVTPEVDAAISAVRAAANPQARHEAYEELVTVFRKTMEHTVDATNPVDRKFMDDLTGAINRRQVAMKQYDLEVAAYRDYLESWRGRVARAVSSQASADWNSVVGLTE